MPRQQSIFSFYNKGRKEDQQTVPYAQLKQQKQQQQQNPQEQQQQQNPQEQQQQQASGSQARGKTAGASKRSSKPAQPRCPLVPGTKRVRDDPPQETSSEQSKRLKLLEAIGGADENVKQGAWAEAQAKFEWMRPANIRDSNGRQPSDPLYDKRTAKIPADVFQKMSASQKQYWETKSQYMDVVLFFKVGKFYELYELDAEIGHKELDWKMTVSGVGKCRQVGVPESGIEDAVQKLVSLGYKVGRMEQIETSEQAKAKRGSSATVERKLVQVFTPSTLTDGISKPDAIHLLAFKEEKKLVEMKTIYACGFAFIDAAAGRCYIGSFQDDDSHTAFESLLMQIAPQEFLYAVGGLSQERLKVAQRYSPPGMLPMFMTPLQADIEFLGPEATLEMISSNGYFKDKESHAQWPDLFSSITDKDNAVTALGALLTHLHRLKMDAELPNTVLCLHELYGRSLRLDSQTLANLELLENTADGTKTGTLIEYLDACATSFGKRLLRRWICRPLGDQKSIEDRLDAVDAFVSNAELSSAVRGHFRRLPDLERLVARIRGFSGIYDTLPVPSRRRFQRMVKILSSAVHGLQQGHDVLRCLGDASTGASLLRAACEKLAYKSSQNSLLNIEELISKEFPTPAAKQDNGDESTLSWLIAEFNQHAVHWSSVVDTLAYIDVLLAFATVASSSTGPTCRPVFVPAQGGCVLELKGLWHPFAKASADGAFVPNDTFLGSDISPRAMLLTGPNMGGKSTLLRATCVAAVLAQLGCFVPAESCKLSLVDTIFTRIGARDRIMSAESTFMVECKEAASILQHATDRSLVVLDELGRGTSTFDGYAVAYAVFRHLVEQVHCRLLFATHYHPLTDEFAENPHVSLQHMACTFKNVSSSSSSTEEEDYSGSHQLVFLYKLKAGPCPRSYGLQVALLAGIPSSVVEAASRARHLMQKQQKPQKHLQWQQEKLLKVLNTANPTSILALWRSAQSLNL